MFLTWWGLAIQHKTQVLKCRYDVDWAQADVSRHGKASPEDETERTAVIRLSLPVRV